MKVFFFFPRKKSVALGIFTATWGLTTSSLKLILKYLNSLPIHLLSRPTASSDPSSQPHALQTLSKWSQKDRDTDLKLCQRPGNQLQNMILRNSSFTGKGFVRSDTAWQWVPAALLILASCKYAGRGSCIWISPIWETQFKLPLWHALAIEGIWKIIQCVWWGWTLCFFLSLPFKWRSIRGKKNYSFKSITHL